MGSKSIIECINDGSQSPGGKRYPLLCVRLDLQLALAAATILSTVCDTERVHAA